MRGCSEHFRGGILVRNKTPEQAFRIVLLEGLGADGARASYFERQKENGWIFSFRFAHASSLMSSRRNPSPSRKRSV